MIWWIIILLILSFLSFLTNMSILFALQVKFPLLSSAILSILVLLCIIMVLIRVVGKIKKGEKETLMKRIQELEKALKAPKEKEE